MFNLLEYHEQISTILNYKKYSTCSDDPITAISIKYGLLERQQLQSFPNKVVKKINKNIVFCIILHSVCRATMIQKDLGFILKLIN
jgi:hypothetical protein